MGEMKEIYTAEHLQEAHLLKNLLEAEGIPAVVLNADLYGLRGAVAMTSDTLPKVAIPEEFMDQSSLIVDRFREERRHALEEGEKRREGAPWICDNCGEEIGAQFTSCWKCSAQNNSQEDVDD